MQGRVIDPPEMFVHHGRQDRYTREQVSVSLRSPAGPRKDSGCFYLGAELQVLPLCNIPGGSMPLPLQFV